MEEVIPIRKIETTRKLDAKTRKDDLALATSISKKGLLVPILVTKDYQLIDGLRRMRAAESLGFTDITAVVTDDFEESVDNLILANDPKAPHVLPVGPERAWQINSGLTPQMWARINKRRAHAIKHGSPMEGDEKKNYSRIVLAEALNLPNGTYLDNICFFYRRVGFQDEIGAFARATVKKLETGELSVYAARGAYVRWAKERAQKSDESTQRQVLSRAATNLTAIARPLSDIGAPHHNLTDDELYEWEQRFKDARTVLTTTINKIHKERDQRSGK